MISTTFIIVRLPPENNIFLQILGCNTDIFRQLWYSETRRCQ